MCFVCAAEESAQSKKTDAIGMLLAVGDIASCSSDTTRSGRVIADMVSRQIDQERAKSPDIRIRILALGDLAYNCGSTADFKCFDATWGRFNNIILPVPGNHDYDHKRGVPPNDRCLRANETGNRSEWHAKPFFHYFRNNEFASQQQQGIALLPFPDAKAGPWLLVGLNPYARISQSRLRTELERTRNEFPCVLAFSHRFYYSSGRHGHGQNHKITLSAPLVASEGMRTVFETLYSTRASLLVAGHDHHYEQLGRANANGKGADLGKSAIDADGVRSFIVGTGGNPLHGNDYIDKWAFQEADDLKSYGFLKIILKANSYDWNFVSTSGNNNTIRIKTAVSTDTCNRRVS
jgi:hypothetical protein